jgi:hypothetical protein
MTRGRRSRLRQPCRLTASMSPGASTRRTILIGCLRQRSPRPWPCSRRASGEAALAGTTGHVAESVAELVLERCGWTPVWHFVGPGRHGVDLLLLGPGEERLFAVEVKGTLRAARWPRLRRAELTQMDVAWLNKTDNPAMAGWGLTSDDVYGAIALLNFADLRIKIALSHDLTRWQAVTDVGGASLTRVGSLLAQYLSSASLMRALSDGYCRARARSRIAGGIRSSTPSWLPAKISSECSMPRRVSSSESALAPRSRKKSSSSPASR